eukprot:765353-Hanusia_phi.AAC.1
MSSARSFPFSSLLRCSSCRPPRLLQRRSLALPASFVQGTMRILRAEAVDFSPALGLLAYHSHSLIANLYNLGCAGSELGMEEAVQLSRLLFHRRDASLPLRAVRSPSMAAYHLDPSAIGHILGLAVARADEEEVRNVLEACGIRSNHVKGRRTGVSRARYVEIVRLLSKGLARPSRPFLLLLLLSFLWEKAVSKRCLLDFLLALNTHVPVLRPEFSLLHLDHSWQESWSRGGFSTEELGDAQVARAAEVVLEEEGTENFSCSLELLAAGMALSQTSKPMLRSSKQRYKEGAEVPDCVELVLREVVDFLLFDPDKNDFDLSRFPPSSSSSSSSSSSPFRLFSFFREEATISDSCCSPSWFALCQELDDCRYLSFSPCGACYELKPGRSNVAAALGHLLAGQVLAPPDPPDLAPILLLCLLLLLLLLLLTVCSSQAGLRSRTSSGSGTTSTPPVPSARLPRCSPPPQVPSSSSNGA